MTFYIENSEKNEWIPPLGKEINEAVEDKREIQIKERKKTWVKISKDCRRNLKRRGTLECQMEEEHETYRKKCKSCDKNFNPDMNRRKHIGTKHIKRCRKYRNRLLGKHVMKVHIMGNHTERKKYRSKPSIRIYKGTCNICSKWINAKN